MKVKNNGTEEIITGDSDSEIHAKLLLTDLEPATKYEVTVASKNKFGLNSPGDLFIFTTKAEGTASTLEYFYIDIFCFRCRAKCRKRVS